jgi:cytosine/adenosine deaminase-related metal-dependent hydrolase
VILAGVRVVGRPDERVDLAIDGGRLALRGGGPRIDLDGLIAFPGLTNSHDHLEFDLYPVLSHGPYADWREWGEDIQARDRDPIDRIQAIPLATRMKAGILRNLVCGVTTVVQHGAAPGFGAPIDVLTPGTCVHSVRERGWRRKLLSPWTPGPIVIHLGEGTSGRARREIDRLLQWNLRGLPIVAVHAVAMHERQARRVAAIVWCPVSNEILLGRTADVARLKQETKVLFGTDATLTGPRSVWDHVRRARAIGALGDRELLASLTTTPAEVWDTRSGRLEPGFDADIVVARPRSDDPLEAFFAVRPEDVVLVAKRGAVVLACESLGANEAFEGLNPAGPGFPGKRVAMETAAVAVVA